MTEEEIAGLSDAAVRDLVDRLMTRATGTDVWAGLPDVGGLRAIVLEEIRRAAENQAERITASALKPGEAEPPCSRASKPT